MKTVAFYVSLTAFLLIDHSVVYGGGVLQVKSRFPLVIHTSMQSQAYQREIKGESKLEQQHNLYLSTSLKPLRIGWFHFGVQSKYTNSSDLNEPYLEPASIYILSGFQLVQDLLYLSGAMSLPITSNFADLNDSTQFFDMINNYSVLSQPNIVPLNTIGVGLHLKKSFSKMHFKLGTQYYKPSSYEFYENIQNFPSPFFVTKFDIMWISSNFHQFTGKVIQFGEEKDRQLRDAIAHREGTLFQGKYAIRFQKRTTAMEGALGFNWKNKDKSRNNKTSRDAVELDVNNNVQNFFLQGTWVQSKWKNALFSASLSPQMLYLEKDKVFGYQNDLAVSLKYRSKTRNFYFITANILVGKLNPETFLGGGLKVSYKFHRSKNNAPGLYPKRRVNP